MDDRESDPLREEGERKVCWTIGLLQQFPTDAQLNREAAHLLYQLGRYEEALPYYQNVTAAQAENGDAWYEVGHTASLAGRYAVAAAALERAITLGRDDAGTRGALASALRHLGKPEAAVEQAEKGLRSTPEPGLLSRLYRMIGTWSNEIRDVEGALVRS